MRWAGYVACIGEEKKNAYSFGGKPRKKEINRKT
jgi:hypothetical protein